MTIKQTNNGTQNVNGRLNNERENDSFTKSRSGVLTSNRNRLDQ